MISSKVSNPKEREKAVAASNKGIERPLSDSINNMMSESLGETDSLAFERMTLEVLIHKPGFRLAVGSSAV